LIWTRSPWSNQFDDGTYDFEIGDSASTGCAAVTLSHDYFEVENVVHAKEKLAPQKTRPCKLIVCTASSHLKAHTSLHFFDNRQQPQPWILDVCLDYFTTINPFLALLTQAVSKDLTETPQLSTVTFLEGIKTVYKVLSTNKSTKRFETSVLLSPQISNDACFAALVGSFDLGQNVTNDLLAYLPHLSHDTRQLIAHAGHCVLLPHHISTQDEVDTLLEELREFLQEHVSHPPCCVIIARSSDDDEYTPKNQVELLQQRVLELVHEAYATDHSKKRKRNPKQLAIHNLYKEENPWAQCRTLFLHADARPFISF